MLLFSLNGKLEMDRPILINGRIRYTAPSVTTLSEVISQVCIDIPSKLSILTLKDRNFELFLTLNVMLVEDTQIREICVWLN